MLRNGLGSSVVTMAAPRASGLKLPRKRAQQRRSRDRAKRCQSACSPTVCRLTALGLHGSTRIDQIIKPWPVISLFEWHHWVLEVTPLTILDMRQWDQLWFSLSTQFRPWIHETSESQRSRATAQVVQGPFVQAQQDPVVHASDQFIQQRGPHGWRTHHGDLRGSTE